MYYIWFWLRFTRDMYIVHFHLRDWGKKQSGGGEEVGRFWLCCKKNLPEPLITLFNIPMVPPCPIPPLIGSYSPPPYSIGDDWSPLHSPRKLCDPPKSFLLPPPSPLPPQENILLRCKRSRLRLVKKLTSEFMRVNELYFLIEYKILLSKRKTNFVCWRHERAQ